MIKAKGVLIKDTETTGAKNAKVFDIAYVIVHGTKIVCRRNFVIRDIITSAQCMLEAINDHYWRTHFGGKVFTFYIPELALGRLPLSSWRDVTETLRSDIREFNVCTLSAYNLEFDMRALANTQEYICASGRVLESKPEKLLCLWNWVCEEIAQNNRLYHEVARAQNWVTSAGNIQTKASMAYKYLSGDFSYVHQHTAMSDVECELEVYLRLKARKKKIPYGIQHMPWKKAQRLY